MGLTVPAAPLVQPDVVDASICSRKVFLAVPRNPDGRDIRAELSEFWSYRVPGWRFRPSVVEGKWDGRRRQFRRGRLATGLFLATRRSAERVVGVRFRERWEPSRPLSFLHGPVSNRRYQQEAVEAMKRSASRGGGLILCATGTGKTWMAGMFCRDVRGSVCFVVDELALLAQAREGLAERVGSPIGIVGDSLFEPRRVTVATIQTLHARRRDAAFRRWASRVDVLIVDEVHTALNHRQFAVLRLMTAVRAVYGLTATLSRSKAVRRRAYELAGPVVFQYSLERGMRERYLASAVVVQIMLESVPDSSASVVRFTEGTGSDYWFDYRRCITRSADRNAFVVDLVRAAVRCGRAVVVMVTQVEHVRTISLMMPDVNHATVHGEVPAAERGNIRRRFEAGKLDCLIVNRVFRKGTDIKRTDCIVDASAGRSAQEAVQGFGRGTRLAAGKNGLIHFDVGDWNSRFAAAASSRRAALSRAGLRVWRVRWDGTRNLDGLVRRAADLAKRKTHGQDNEPGRGGHASGGRGRADMATGVAVVESASAGP